MLNPARILPNHAEQGVLFSEHFVGDRLPKNHPVFAFKELIQKLDLSILDDNYSREGGHMFAPHGAERRWRDVRHGDENH